jgi:hypothetical protein
MKNLEISSLLSYSLFLLLIACNTTEEAKKTGIEPTKINKRTLVGYSTNHTVRVFRLDGVKFVQQIVIRVSRVHNQHLFFS